MFTAVCTTLMTLTPSGRRTDAVMAVVGFIGLGNMGAHMARNLIKSGHKLVVYDMLAKPLQELKADGAEVAQSPADVAAAARDIVTMLPSSPHVRSVYTGDNGIFKTLQKGSLCMDSSTIDQAVSIEMAKLAAEKGAAYMDTPVSGGVVAAQNALLTFMCGGEVNSFTRAEKYLTKMGKNVVHCGAVGTGQGAKICNNMLLGISMIGVAETMNLGEKLGLKPEMLAKIINTSSGRCWSSDTYNPVPGIIDGIPSNRNYSGGFGSSLMAKDLGLAQNAATEAKSPTPLGSLAHQIYRLLAQSPEFRDKDFSVVYQFLKEQQSKS